MEPGSSLRRRVAGSWHDDGMEISRTLVVLDAADLDAVSSFWSGLLAGTVEADDDWHTIYVDGEPRMGIQLAPDHIPPEWPDGTPQQLHLDLYVEDVAIAHEEATALGARLLKAADDLAAKEGFQVYADPAVLPVLGLMDDRLGPGARLFALSSAVHADRVAFIWPAFSLDTARPFRPDTVCVRTSATSSDHPSASRAGARPPGRPAVLGQPDRVGPSPLRRQGSHPGLEVARPAASK